MKKFLIISLVFFSIIFFMFVGWDLYVEIESSYIGLEFLNPLNCRREVTKLTFGIFFDEEKLDKYI